jgi:hypothetical protein
MQKKQKSWQSYKSVSNSVFICEFCDPFLLAASLFYRCLNSFTNVTRRSSSVCSPVSASR